MQATTNTTASPLIIAGFHALSDPLRLQVLELLRQGELCVCDLCELMQVSQSKLSFHLKTLKDADLVHSRQEKRWIYYRLNLAQILTLQKYLSDYQLFNSSFLPRSCNDSP